MRNGHRLEQSNSVKEGANEKESQAQRMLCKAADNHCFMSFFCATHQFLLSWLEKLYWKWVHPLLIKMNLLQAFTHRTNGHSGQRGRLFSSHHGQHTAGFREEGIFLTFTSAEVKAQLDFPLSTAALTTKHVRNIVVCSFYEMMEV